MSVWKTSKLSDIGLIQTGSTPKTSIKENFGDSIPFVKPADFHPDGSINYHNDGLSEQGLATSRLIKKESVLMVCIGATIGKVGFSTIEITTNQQINSFTPNTNLFPRYFYYAMLADNFKLKVLKNSGQATLPIINKTKWSNLEVSYPEDAEEQKRIVAILDQAFAEIDKARANAEQNLKNASELFDSYLQQIFSQGSDDWVNTNLGEQIDLLTGYAFKSKEYVTHQDSIKMVRGDNIIQGCLRWDGVKLWPSEKVSEYKKYLLASNDIVLAMDRTWVKAGMKYSKISIDDLPCLLVQRVARLRCNEQLNSDFLYYLIGSKNFESYVLSIQTGLGVPHISGKQIHSFEFQMPPITKQKQLVEKLNTLSINTTSLIDKYQTKLESLDELKKAILQKAFSGELTNNKGLAA